jgi:uncharacterized protein
MADLSPAPGSPFLSLSRFLRDRFGGKIRKVSLDGGFSCPNRNIKERRGGCFWCDPHGSGPGRDPAVWEEHLSGQARKHLNNGYKGVIAYFQAFSNTFGDAAFLNGIYDKALSIEGVEGIAIGTRPDCLSEEIYGLLDELNRKSFLWVEIGMQTKHDKTLALCNRGHDHEATVTAVSELQKRGIKVVLHLIAGLPGESEEMILESFDEAARLKPWGVKLHPLHIVSGSEFEKWYHEDRIKLLSIKEYAALAAALIKKLDKNTVIHRITGERPEGVLIAPEWCRDKNKVRREILNILSRESPRD